MGKVKIPKIVVGIIVKTPKTIPIMIAAPIQRAQAALPAVSVQMLGDSAKAREVDVTTTALMMVKIQTDEYPVA